MFQWLTKHEMFFFWPLSARKKWWPQKISKTWREIFKKKIKKILATTRILHGMIFLRA
jgi:hypothetical protein